MTEIVTHPQTTLLSKNLTNALKGLAVILVIISHFLGGGYEIRYFTPLGGIGVAIFLFLSGYGINESFHDKGLDGYWRKKITRIVVPYLIWCLLLALIVWLLPCYSSPFFRRYWYLEYLFLWYLLYWCTRRFCPNHTIILLILVAFCLFPIMSNIQTEQSFSFVSGVLASEHKGQLQKLRRSHWAVTALLSFSVGVAFLYLKQMPSIRAFGEESIVIKLVQLGIKLPIGLLIIVMGFNLFQDNVLFKIFRIFGLVSLELYLVQMPFPGYIQGNWVNLIQISALVAVLTITLHCFTKWFNTIVVQRNIFVRDKPTHKNT